MSGTWSIGHPRYVSRLVRYWFRGASRVLESPKGTFALFGPGKGLTSRGTYVVRLTRLTSDLQDDSQPSPQLHVSAPIRCVPQRPERDGVVATSSRLAARFESVNETKETEHIFRHSASARIPRCAERAGSAPERPIFGFRPIPSGSPTAPARAIPCAAGRQATRQRRSDPIVGNGGRTRRFAAHRSRPKAVRPRPVSSPRNCHLSCGTGGA